MEVSCSRCQRRYAVADYKVVGRRRTSRCRCGNLLVFDGRVLSVPGLEGIAPDTQPLEPTLTPPPTQPEAREQLPPPREPRDVAANAPADPKSIGRIRLQKAEPRPTEETREWQPPSAPSTHVAPSPSRPPDSPRRLHEAFDSLDLDRLAESIRPIWEAPASQRVTPPGEDPEVIVHYPSAWQPPPSARRRMRASSEVTPTMPLSLGPQTSGTLDEDGETSTGELAPSAPSSPTAFELAATIDSAEPPPVELPPPALSERAGASESNAPDEGSPPAPEAALGVGKSGGPRLESTAPTTVSQHPPARPRSSTAKLWGAGLAAAAAIALVWRSTNTQPTDPSGATAAAPARLGEERVDTAPVAAPHAPAAPAPSPVATDTPTTAPAPTPEPMPTPEPAPPAATAAAAVPQAARPQTPSQRPAGEARGGALAPAAVGPRPAPPIQVASSEASDPAPRSLETAGPDPGEVARALGVAAARARTCTGPAGFPANGSIRILLDPSGGVLNATTLGPFQGTAAGACVENAFRTAQTPAYGGRSLSTLYSFSISAD